MPALTFLAVVGLALVALLFVADATLESVSPIVTSQHSGLPKPWQPDEVKILTNTPAPGPDMKSQAVLNAQPKSAPDEAMTKIHPAARAARAEAPPKNKRVTHQPVDGRVTQPIGHQQNLFDRFSIKGY
jgi:hypothetical protein